MGTDYLIVCSVGCQGAVQIAFKFNQSADKCIHDNGEVEFHGESVKSNEVIGDFSLIWICIFLCISHLRELVTVNPCNKVLKDFG